MEKPPTVVRNEPTVSASTTDTERGSTEIENNTHDVASETGTVDEQSSEAYDPAKLFATDLINEMLERDRVVLFIASHIEWRNLVLLVQTVCVILKTV